MSSTEAFAIDRRLRGPSRLTAITGLMLFLATGDAGADGSLFGPQRIIEQSDTWFPLSLVATDLDGDGDQDGLATSVTNSIAWYMNTDGKGTFGPPREITTMVNVAKSVVATDLDGDGDIDVVSASTGNDTIAWYENMDGKGAFGPPQVITSSADDAVWVHAADLDGDGDQDVLSVSFGDHKIAWHENLSPRNTVLHWVFYD